MFVELKDFVWRWLQGRPWNWLFLPVLPVVANSGKQRRERSTKQKLPKVLIIHFGAMGDALMATPAIRLLRQSYPSAEIHVLTASRSAMDIYRRNSNVTTVGFLQQYDRGNIKERFGSPRSLWGNRLLLFALYPTLVIRLLRENYDIGVALGPLEQGATFSNVMFDLIGIPRRVGALGEHTDLLTHAANPSIARLHWVDFYREIIKTVIAEPCLVDDSLDYAVSETENARAGEFLRAHGIRHDQTIAVIHPGGSLYINSKRWPAEKFAKVADALDGRFAVVLTGSADEKNVVECVAQGMHRPVINAAGKLSFGETAALLKRASLIITNDTGILHLADAVRAPHIISLFGPTNPNKIAPRNGRNRIVRSGLECAPCIDFDAGDPSRRCWRAVKEECLHGLSPEDVLQAIPQSFKRTSRVPSTMSAVAAVALS